MGGIAIMTAHGRRVLPYLPSLPPPSRGSMAYKVFKEPIHVYMDTFGSASPNGVIKVRLSPLPPSLPPSLSFYPSVRVIFAVFLSQVLCKLQPSHKRRQDIASYFTGESPDEPMSKRAR